MESYVEMHHNEWLLRPPSSTDFTAGPGTFKSSSSLTHRRVAVAFLVVVRGGAQRRQERHLCWRDLKMLDDGFQHHVGGHDVQLSIIAMRYCYIDPRHHQIFFFFHSSHTDLKQHWLGPSSINVSVVSLCAAASRRHRDHVR